MLRRTLPCIVVLLTSVWQSAVHAADTILRKGEKSLSGEVTGMSRTEVTVKVKTLREDTLKIPANEVQSIVWSGEGADANLARSDEAAGRYQKALDEYQKAITSSKSSNPAAKADLEFGVARVSARQALTDPTKSDDAVKKLEEFRSKQGDHYRYYEAVQLLSQLHLARKDFIKAQAALDTLGKAPWDSTRSAARIGTARLLAAENKFDEAVAAFDAVIAQSTDGSTQQSQQAMLGKSRVLIAQGKFDDAQKLLQEVINKADEDDASINAEAYVRLGDCLREQANDSDALLAYLRVDILYPSEKDYQAEALFHLVRLWDKTGHKGRSAEARDKLESDEFKGSAWARQLGTPSAGG